MSDPSARHVPVLLERCVALLAPAIADDGAVLVDATVGLGGHSEAFLRAFPGLRLVGLDRDGEALAIAGERLAPYGERVTLVHTVYDGIPQALARLRVRHVQGVLFDLGVSSLQLDETARGFSYAHDAPLDMRMDQSTRPYGGRRPQHLSSRGPRAGAARVRRGALRPAHRGPGGQRPPGGPFDRSARLVELVRDAIPAATRRTGGNPAKRTFQALRIEVNGELAALERALPAALDALAVGGRIVVMSYQSLEDRLVKRVLAEAASSTAPEDLPFVPEDMQPRLRLLTRGAEQADDAQVAANPRAASVRLRAAERLRAAA